jgi:alpha-beta hydrolase superfamily lysophospholipase
VVTEHRFISFDETPIFYRQYNKGNRPPKAVAFLVHGMGEHGGRYAAFAEHLRSLEFQVLVPDLRGFGMSGGRRVFVKRFSDFHEDLHALRGWAERQNPGVPVFMIGHSFGGLVVSSYLAFHGSSRIRGMVLSSPIFGIASPVPFWRHALGIFSSYAAPAYTQATRLKPELLTHDAEILAHYTDDPLIFHRISARLYRELCFMMARRDEIAKKITCPSLILQAGRDFIVSREKTVLFYEALNARDKKLKLYEGLYHEIFNEVGREEIFSLVGEWILAH